jgi:hypothetical protein
MPAYGTHMLILEKTIQKLLEDDNPNIKKIGNFLKNNKNLASLGSIGPDLFYATQDTVKSVEPVGKFISVFTQDAKKFFDDIESTLKAGEETHIPLVGLACHIGEEAVDYIEASAMTVINSVYTLLYGIGNFLITSIMSFMSPNGSPVHGMALYQELQSDGGALHGTAEKDWSWGDILHSEISGSYAHALLKSIANKEVLDPNELDSNKMLAYVMGFLSHISGDLAGHPYVNQVVGGPARNHSWRHRLSETVIDKYLWQKVKGEDIALTSLDSLISISYSEKETLSNYLATACQEICNSRSTNPICGSQLRPIKNPPSKAEISGYIDNTVAILKLLHELDLPYPDPPDTFTVSDALKETAEAMSEAADVLLPDDIDSITDVLKAIFGGILLLAYAAEQFLENLIASAVSYGFTIPRSGLYIFQIYVYYMYYSMRRLLVFSGLLYPDNMLMAESYAQQFLNGSWDPNYPHKRDVIIGLSGYDAIKALFNGSFQVAFNAAPEEAVAKLQESKGKVFDLIEQNKQKLEAAQLVYDRNPFEYPKTPVELPSTLSGPFVNKPPECLLEGKFDLNTYAKYANFETPESTNLYNNSVVSSLQNPNSFPLIGDPVGVSLANIKFLFVQPFKPITGSPIFKPPTFKPFPDWHLDSDRGYGYKLWIIPETSNLLGNPVTIKGYCKNPEL